MQQHPIPQQISSYEFRLVGDMTLKQFFQLAGGAVFALIIYSTGLPALIKWPLVLFFAITGAALAFLPLEERPLSTWIFAFFKAVYSPTKYTWEKGASEDVFSQGHMPQDATLPATQPAVQTPQEANIVDPFEKEEETFLQKTTQLFQSVTPVVPSSTPPQAQPITPTPQPVIPAPPIPNLVSLQPAVVPQLPIKVEPVHQAPMSPPVTPKIEYTQQAVTPVFQQQSQNQPTAQQAVFTPDASPPNPPTIVNTVSGQVLASDGRIVEGAILEIRDTQGRPVRALRSNKVGHFLTVTPLQNGMYEIEAEKDGFLFETVKVSAEGGIIPPILIRSKNVNA